MWAQTSSTHPSATAGLDVIEATLATGALVDAPANAAPTGRKWRVRIFEYGLSKNRYPVARESTGRGQEAGAMPSTAPLQWTRRSAEAALRHLELPYRPGR